MTEKTVTHLTTLLDLRQWRQFAMLADELHFGRAAQRLHITQPPLTQAIASMERVLGMRLFDRNKRTVRLTPSGELLLPEVRDLLKRAQALQTRAHAVADGREGELRLAFVSSAGFELLPRWVRSFRARWPKVVWSLTEATGDVQTKLLADGAIDAGLMLHAPGFAPTGLSSWRAWSEPMVLALPESHPLAAAPRLALHKVLAEPLVVFPRRILPSLHDALMGLYHAAGREPQVQQEAIQMQTIVNLVAAGMGVAWVPESVQPFRRPGVVYRRVWGTAKSHIPVGETSLVWRSDAVSPSLARLIEMVQAAPQRQHAKATTRRAQ